MHSPREERRVKQRVRQVHHKEGCTASGANWTAASLLHRASSEAHLRGGVLQSVGNSSDVST